MVARSGVPLSSGAAHDLYAVTFGEAEHDWEVGDNGTIISGALGERAP